MRFSVILLFALILFAGCAPEPEIVYVTATATPVSPCGIWTSSDDSVTCIRSGNNALLVQSDAEQVTLNAYNLSLVLQGTVVIVQHDDLRFINLEGDVIIGASGQNRVLRPGREVSVSLVEDMAQIPSEISQLAVIPADLQLDELPRVIDITGLIPTSTPIPTRTPLPSATPDICLLPENWTRVYVVESGDTLEQIARRFDIELEELAGGNCIRDMSRIPVGQEIFLPSSAEATESPESTETFTVGIGFRADDYAITAGNCTTLRWDAVDTEAIYLDNVAVTQSYQEICPDETTSYTLYVVFADGREEFRELTVSVTP